MCDVVLGAVCGWIQGSAALEVTRNHSLSFSMGEASPLSAVYRLNGYVLLLGVPYENCTALHLAEHRAKWVRAMAF